MNRRFLLVLLPALAIFIAACASPSSGGVTPTISSDAVGTVVAMTLEALTPESDDEGTPEPTPQPGLLPHTFYYLGNDDAGLAQVFRVERDGKTQTQLTFEAVKVEDYDVSPVDGKIAFVVNNQLLLANADGSDRRVLVDGGAEDENNPYLTRISSPVFSLNGQTIAYGHKGLNFYAVSTGVSNLVIENQWDDFGSGQLIPKELYWPEKYSPDGSKLLITLGYYEGASAAIYYPAGNALVRLTGAEGALICCDETEWSADGSTFHSASRSAGMFTSGLWSVDPASGAVTTLFTSNYDTGPFNYADEPYLAPDGNLYFFFAAADSEFNSRTLLQLVRSEPDGVTDRTVLRPETFELMNEVLWAPDASFVVVAFAPIPDIYFGGKAEIVYLDGKPNVTLATFAQQMKWGP